VHLVVPIIPQRAATRLDRMGGLGVPVLFLQHVRLPSPRRTSARRQGTKAKDCASSSSAAILFQNASKTGLCFSGALLGGNYVVPGD
jgi:hypothetical protein